MTTIAEGLQGHFDSFRICHRSCCAHARSTPGILARQNWVHEHCNDQRKDQLWTHGFYNRSLGKFLPPVSDKWYLWLFAHVSLKKENHRQKYLRHWFLLTSNYWMWLSRSIESADTMRLQIFFNKQLSSVEFFLAVIFLMVFGLFLLWKTCELIFKSWVPVTSSRLHCLFLLMSSTIYTILLDYGKCLPSLVNLSWL